MSSLAGKMSLLVDEYNHSKTSPAYRKLSIKYKALKKTNQDLIRLLTTVFAEFNSSKDENKIRKQTKKTQNILPDYVSDEDQDEELDSEFQENTKCGDELFEECGDVEEDGEGEEDEEMVEEEEGEADCDDEEDTEDPDIKEQIIQEQVAEDYAGEPSAQITTEEVVVEEEEVVEGIVEEEEVEEEEVEEIVEEEIVEEVVEEEEEVVVEEEVEEEEVEEEEEEEEAGVYEIEVNGTRYYTTNEKDGIVYSVLEDEDVGDEIGKFINGKLFLN